MPIAIRRILQISRRQSFPKGITKFEIREFFTLRDVDLRAIRIDSNRKPRVALALRVGFLRMTNE